MLIEMESIILSQHLSMKCIKYEKVSAGEGIRTLVGLRQRILSPPPLSARVPLQPLYYVDRYKNLFVQLKN